MPNRLTTETSPYLLQHAENPVDWYPWGEEALGTAVAEDKPILLSIGYAACHWCHVMAHESFEDLETAEFMNNHFINIKVDREERPDLDSIYMDAVVSMTGQGGWPMTVVLTPDGEPFFGGTYYPKTPRYGMPSFKQVLASIARAWQEQRREVSESASRLAQQISETANLNKSVIGELSESSLIQAQAAIENSYDGRYGGFSAAPKFPQPMAIEFLIRRYLSDGDSKALYMAEFSLEKMAYGGIYDQIGGGFARYSTDEYWLVPHFEKMLYDNALLCRVYLHAWQVTRKPLYRKVVEETLDWALKEMRDPEGGFFSSLDADSEGEEGKFYTWDKDEIMKILGEESELISRHFGVEEQGNWEGKSILSVTETAEELSQKLKIDIDEIEKKLADARSTLYDFRSERTWPGLDDKVLTSWNGLMLAAFAEAGRELNRSDYTEAAVSCAEFLYQNMRDDSGRLWRTWKAGSSAKLNAYLEDYAYLADGLLALYQNTFEIRWFEWAQELVNMTLSHFMDVDAGGFFDTSDDHEELIHRPKGLQDNATPSGNAMAVHVLLQMYLFTGDSRYWDLANDSFQSVGNLIARYPIGFSQWLNALELVFGETREVAIRGDIDRNDTRALLNSVFDSYRPNIVVAVGRDTDIIPLLANRSTINNQATAYVCQRFSCKNPVTSPRDLAAQLNE